MDIYRLRVEWSGTAVTGRGLSTFYAVDDPTDLPAKVLAFWVAIAGYLAIGSSITVPSTGDTLDASTGVLTGVWTSTGGGVTGGAATGAYAQGVGARAVWSTDLIENGRRVRGSTFLVPLGGSMYDTDGTIKSTALGGSTTAASDLVTAMAGNLAVWHRPGPKGAGVPAVVTSSTVPDKISWLRSRRT